MFGSLTEKIEKVFKKLRGQAVLTEQNITDALKEVRLALLEADVNFKIVKDFIEKIKGKAVGQEVLKGLNPAHQVVKIVWDELRDLLGQDQSGLHLSSSPSDNHYDGWSSRVGKNYHHRQACQPF